MKPATTEIAAGLGAERRGRVRTAASALVWAAHHHSASGALVDMYRRAGP